MGLFSKLFKKPQAPQPYDWAFLKQVCLDAIDLGAAPKGVVKSPIDTLDYDRLAASGDAEEVVMEIWAVLKNAKTPGLSTSQVQEYLYRASGVLSSGCGPREALSRFHEIEECLRKK